MSPSPLPPNTLIFDIGDVLFSWSAKTTTSISPLTLKAILNSTTWFDYERGRLSQDECYHRVGTQFSLDPSEIEQAFIQARDSLQPNEQVIACIRELKANSNGQLRVFAMSNISAPDYECLRTKPADWSIFDHVFTSAAVGERKPNLAFYRHVIAAASVDPQRAIFVDDKLDNVLSARSLGFHGIVFDEPEKVLRTLRNLVGEPIPRAREFLSTNAGVLNSVTDTGIELYENFAQLLILEATEDRCVFIRSNQLPV
jgi:FMN phosphatase YigB (HAD superfamily)